MEGNCLNYHDLVDRLCMWTVDVICNFKSK